MKHKEIKGFGINCIIQLIKYSHVTEKPLNAKSI